MVYALPLNIPQALCLAKDVWLFGSSLHIVLHTQVWRVNGRRAANAGSELPDTEMITAEPRQYCRLLCRYATVRIDSNVQQLNQITP